MNDPEYIFPSHKPEYPTFPGADKPVVGRAIPIRTPNPPTRIATAAVPPDDERLAAQLAARSLTSWRRIAEILKNKHGIRLSVRAGEQWEVRDE